MESRIKALLEKYWEGNTSLQEEKELKAYFLDNNSVIPMTQYANQLQTMKEKSPAQKFTHPGKKQRQTWLSIAASLLLGISVAFWVLNDARNQRDYVIEDPQEAYEMTRKALFMLSANLNEGVAYSEPLTKINEAQELITESKENKK